MNSARARGAKTSTFNELQTDPKRLFTLFLLFLCLTGSMGIVGCSGVASSPSAQTGAIISANPSSVSFGNVATGTTNTQIVKVSNSGNADMKISQASVTGAGFSMSGLNAPVTIAAGQSSTFTASFSPTTTTSYSGSVSITSNASNSPTTMIPLNGTGMAQVLQLSASPNPVAFGNVAAGSSSTRPVTLTNSGNANLTVSQITALGTSLSQTGIALPVTLSPNQTAAFNAVFSPTGAVNLNGTITVISTASNSPTVVSATGTGFVPIPHSVTMNWTASTSTVVGYFVYRGTASGGPYTKLNTTSVAPTTYADSTVVSGQIYFYVVTAVDSNSIESLFSNEVTAAIPIP